MKIGFTINLGEYESMRIDSSEFDSPEACIDEIGNALIRTNNLKAKAFGETLLKQYRR